MSMYYNSDKLDNGAEILTHNSEGYDHLEQLDHVIEGLEKAGAPAIAKVAALGARTIGQLLLEIRDEEERKADALERIATALENKG